MNGISGTIWARIGGVANRCCVPNNFGGLLNELARPLGRRKWQHGTEAPGAASRGSVIALRQRRGEKAGEGGAEGVEAVDCAAEVQDTQT